MRSVSGWLAHELGPIVVRIDGVDQTPRGALNLIGCTAVDNAEENSVDITLAGGGDITDEIVTWSPTASPYGTSTSAHKTYDTSGATQSTAMTIALADESFVDLQAVVLGRSEDDRHFAIDLRASWSRTDAAAPDERRAPATSNALGTNPGGWAAVFDVSGNNARVRVTGEAALAIRWSVLATAQVVSIGATPGGYDPAILSLTGWWRADFASSPWSPTASAGSSGANGDLEEATNPPGVGTAQNGYDPADFDGTNDRLNNASTAATLFNVGAGSVAVLFYANSAAAPAGSAVDDEQLLGDSGPYMGLVFTSSGVRAYIYDSGAAYQTTASSAASTGAWHLAQMKWDATDLYSRVDSGAWSAGVPTTGPLLLTGTLVIGKNYNTSYFDGNILDIITADSTLSDGDFDNLVVYVNDRYGLSL